MEVHMQIIVCTPHQIGEAKALRDLAVAEGVQWEELREQLLPSMGEEEVRWALASSSKEPRYGLNLRGS
jgi:hypothetical protein